MVLGDHAYQWVVGPRFIENNLVSANGGSRVMGDIDNDAQYILGIQWKNKTNPARSQFREIYILIGTLIISMYIFHKISNKTNYKYFSTKKNWPLWHDGEEVVDVRSRVHGETHRMTIDRHLQWEIPCIFVPTGPGIRPPYFWFPVVIIEKVCEVLYIWEGYGNCERMEEKWYRSNNIAGIDHKKGNKLNWRAPEEWVSRFHILPGFVQWLLIWYSLWISK